MSKFKGTKGKWSIRKSLINSVCIRIDLGESLNQIDCWTNDSDSREEMMANAKLVAAAPDMLEALENLENDDGHIPKSIWDMVQSAIKKATE